LAEERREITLEELSAFDGTQGKPAYIAYKDWVIDVSHSVRWKGGVHMARHHAGRDLTDEFKNAPHELEVLKRYPQIGVLRKETTVASETPRIPKTLARALDRFPILKRFTIAAILSGLFTWWLNYEAQPIKPVIIKIILSPILFLIGIVAFIWRLVNPNVLEHIQGMSILYLLLILSLAPLALVIGWFGGMLTFPIHKE
jgi:predicted heme/steroid binding protein